MRIASLIPSGTDLVAALGLGSHLVGVSHECDHPEAIGLPVLTSSVIPPPTADGPSLTPREIDTIVTTSVAAGESLYRTNRELLRSLAPDVVVSQDVCDVCAVNADDAFAAMCEVAPGARLVMLTATSVDGMYADLCRLGDALGVRDRADEVVAAVRARLARATTSRKPRSMLTLEWGEPPFLGGHWVPELVELAGIRHALTDAGAPSRRSTWDEIAEADPDLIVFCPCGYDLHQATTEAKALAERPDVASLRAVREGNFYAVDANRLFSRCTTNIAEAVELLGHLGSGAATTYLPAGAARIAPSFS
jgi:iron complex transport system substrate-binding protein